MGEQDFLGHAGPRPLAGSARSGHLGHHGRHMSHAFFECHSASARERSGVLDCLAVGCSLRGQFSPSKSCGQACVLECDIRDVPGRSSLCQIRFQWRWMLRCRTVANQSKRRDLLHNPRVVPSSPRTALHATHGVSRHLDMVCNRASVHKIHDTDKPGHRHAFSSSNTLKTSSTPS